MLMTALISLIYLVFTPLIWRLRGGAWNTFFGLSLGTNTTRLLTGFLLSIPIALAMLNLWMIPVVTISITSGLMLTGWGPYMGMGSHAYPAKDSWIDFLPKFLGFVKGSMRWDFFGMVASGIIFLIPAIIIGAIYTAISFGGLAAIILLSFGIPAAITFSFLFGACYLIAKTTNLRDFPRIDGLVSCYNKDCVYQHEEWAEVFVGVLIAIFFIILIVAV